MDSGLKTSIAALGMIALAGCLARQAIHPEAVRHNQIGAGLLNAGRLREARVALQLSLEYSPCHANALHNLALVAYLERELEAARDLEYEALSCNPGLVQAINGLGAIERSAGNLKQAIELFARALDLDPGYISARKNLIGSAIEAGEQDLAEEQVERLEMLSASEFAK